MLIYGEGQAKLASVLEDTFRDKVHVAHAVDAFDAGVKTMEAKPTWLIVDWTDVNAPAMVKRVTNVCPNVLVCIIAAGCPIATRRALQHKWPMVVDEPVTMEQFITAITG